MVPDAAAVVHALAAVAQESASLAGLAIGRGGGDHHQEGKHAEGHERLAAERMTLDFAQVQRKADRLPAEDAEHRVPAISPDIDAREVVEAQRAAFVDRKKLRSFGLDHVAKG